MDNNYNNEKGTVIPYENNVPVSLSEKFNNGMDRCEGLLGQVQDISDQMLAVSDAAQNIANLYTQCQAFKARTEQVKAWSNVQMANTIAKYKVCQQFLESTFGERNEALQKHYELMDKAMESGDRELILASMQGISNIVTKSPLDELEQFAKVFNNPDLPLLDF